LSLESDEELPPAACPGASAVEVLAFAEDEAAIISDVADIVPHPTGPPVAEAGHSASEALLESFPDLAVEVPAPLSTEGFVVVARPSASEGAHLESVVGSDMPADSVPLVPTSASAVEATTTNDSVVEMEMKGPDSTGYFTQATSQRKWARITPKFGASVAVKCYTHANCSIAMAEWK